MGHPNVQMEIKAQRGELTYLQKGASLNPYVGLFPLYWSLAQRIRHLGSKLIYRQRSRTISPVTLRCHSLTFCLAFRKARLLLLNIDKWGNRGTTECPPSDHITNWEEMSHCAHKEGEDFVVGEQDPPNPTFMLYTGSHVGKGPSPWLTGPLKLRYCPTLEMQHRGALFIFLPLRHSKECSPGRLFLAQVRGLLGGRGRSPSP